MKTAVKNEKQPIPLAIVQAKPSRDSWNKGKLLEQKPPLKLKEVWEIRIRLQLSHNLRELALFNLAIDSKLQGCDLVKLKVRNVAHGDQVLKRAMVMQQKTHQPVQFEITEQTRNSASDWIKQAKLKSDDYLFPSRIHDSPHITTQQYVRILEKWVASIGLNPTNMSLLPLPRSFAELDSLVSHGLPKQALKAIVDNIALNTKERKQLLYRIVPEATYKRRRDKLSAEESERTERLARIYATAQYVWSSEAETRAFLHTSHPLLQGRTPLDVSMTELGARRVEELLWRLYYGIAA